MSDTVAELISALAGVAEAMKDPKAWKAKADEVNEKLAQTWQHRQEAKRLHEEA